MNTTERGRTRANVDPTSSRECTLRAVRLGKDRLRPLRGKGKVRRDDL